MIGAGVAGLAASQSLSEAGVKVRILEARSRIGGRIYTIRDLASGAPVELGAEFIHGKPKEIISITEAAGLAITEVSTRHAYLRNGEPDQRADLWERIDSLFSRMADPALPDQTFSEFLARERSDDEVKSRARDYVEGFNAAWASRIGARSLAYEMKAAERLDSDHSFRVRDGYDRVAQRLRQTLASSSAELYLNTVVTELKWRKGKVEVEAQSLGSPISFRAEKAVITVPLGVLQAPATSPGGVRFEPEVTAVREALSRLEMGQATRITLAFRPQFWKKEQALSHAGFIFSDDPSFPAWWTGSPAGLPLITGWAGGPRSERLSRLRDVSIAEVAFSSLGRMLKMNSAALANQVERWTTHNWTTDPFSRGAYSYARVGGLEARRVLATPIESTLYFAGEAAEINGHSATVHGAIATGHRAARDIMQSMA